MAVANGLRRISVILDADVDASLSRVSKLRGVPVATLVREVLSEAEPAFKMTADALEVVQSNPQRAVKQMIRFFDDQVAEAHQEVFPLRRKRGRPRKG